MSILDRFVSVYAPFCCLGCGAEANRLICESCSETIAKVPPRCYRCQATTRGYLVCERCKPKTPLRRVAIWAHYDGLPKQLIRRAKYERARQGLNEAAHHIAPLLKQFKGDTVLVPIPTASSRARERGYDQAEVLARRLSKLSGLPTKRYLVRIGQAHQVGASRAERVAHLKQAFRTRGSVSPEQHIVLIDDVSTTGATLESAARALKAAGFKHVDALVFAQPN